MSESKRVQVKKIGIVGAGPAGLMAGYELLKQGHEVHFYDQKKGAGRKFLVAGNGGFNLTHSEGIERFKERYNRQAIKNAVDDFSNEATITWLHEIGIDTYVGSSGKIFPKVGVKPIEVLEAWMKTLRNNGASFHFSNKLIDFCENTLTFLENELHKTNEFDFVIFALGGGSWTKTGSTGDWMDLFSSKGIQCLPFQASNSGLEIEEWSRLIPLAGELLKNVTVKCGSFIKHGDVRITKYGLEGPPIYFVNRGFREEKCALQIDLKPTKTTEQVRNILDQGKNNTDSLKLLNLSKSAIQFIKSITTMEQFTNKDCLTNVIKELKFKKLKLRPVEEVISTVGGIDMSEVDANFQLKKVPRVFVCGEMLDWDAPTGGYLLQACFSTGYRVAQTIDRYGED
jgi:uncharacterized flavoprotein (TIGR03862 family)